MGNTSSKKGRHTSAAASALRNQRITLEEVEDNFAKKLWTIISPKVEGGSLNAYIWCANPLDQLEDKYMTASVIRILNETVFKDSGLRMVAISIKKSDGVRSFSIPFFLYYKLVPVPRGDLRQGDNETPPPYSIKKSCP